MQKKISSLVLLFLFACIASIAGINKSFETSDLPDYNLNWTGRAFFYNAYDFVVDKGPCKTFLNTPNSVQNIFADPGNNYLSAGSFDGLGNYFGIRYLSNELYRIDTITGVMSQVGTISNGNIFVGMGWDPTTVQMYALNYYGSTIQLGILNTDAASWTPIGTPVTSDTIIDIAISNNGEIFAHRFISPPGSNSEIIKINKSTNAITIIGSTGFSPYNYYIGGMSWDRNSDSCYIVSHHYSVNREELRRVNIVSGMTTLVGVVGPNNGTQIYADAFAIPGGFAPKINHTQLLNTEQSTGVRSVNCTILTAGSGINPAKTKLFYSKNNTVFTDSVLMTNSNGNNWTANIAISGLGLYRYYIKTTDSINAVGTAPAGAPVNYYSFISLIDTAKPVIAHTPIQNTPKALWPAYASAVVTDNIGLDSVWVKWYKNTPATMSRRFRMNYTGGNNYSAFFNSVQSEVYLGDVIYYRIFAQDNSGSHNIDSTTLYNFAITYVSLCQMGTGTDTSKYPFTTYWMDGRTQMLFTSSELSACGIPWGGITKIGFRVITVAQQTMNGFNIRFMNTTQTSLSGFDNSGNWQTVYSGSYAVQDTGWQFIILPEPYFWYQHNFNLLIEICYHNTSYTQYSLVNATPNPGKTWGYYMDNIPGCTMTAGSSQSLRPNVWLEFITATGANGNNNNIPGKYILHQNYPNPFNPVTKINYDLPKNGFVSLRVYDMLGREIRTLVNEEKPAGSYSVDFNASEFSTGVYFYKLESNEFTDVKRLVLIK